MKKSSRKLFITGFIIILAIATHTAWLPLPAEFLAPKDNAGKADAMVVLSGDWMVLREEKAAELYKQGFADKIIRILEVENNPFVFAKKVLGLNIAQEAAYRVFFESRGVRPADLILGDEVATSTFDEFKAVKEIVLKNNFHSIMIVTGDYHMRRSLMTARWVFRGCGIKIYNVSVRSGAFCPKRWWASESNVKGVVLEYLSVLFYLVYHFGLGR